MVVRFGYVAGERKRRIPLLSYDGDAPVVLPPERTLARHGTSTDAVVDIGGRIRGAANWLVDMFAQMDRDGGGRSDVVWTLLEHGTTLCTKEYRRTITQRNAIACYVEGERHAYIQLVPLAAQYFVHEASHAVAHARGCMPSPETRRSRIMDETFSLLAERAFNGYAATYSRGVWRKGAMLLEHLQRQHPASGFDQTWLLLEDIANDPSARDAAIRAANIRV